MAGNDEKKIKVLEVIYNFGFGGIRSFIMNYLQHIDKDKFDIDIYAFGCSSSPFTDKVHELGANIYFEPENNVCKIPKFVRQLYVFMKTHGPYDVVHAHTNLISAWVLLAAKMAKIPVRLPHSHSTSHFGKSLIQRIYSYSRRYLIDLLATKKLSCGNEAGIAMYGKKAEFEVIANGISIDRFMTPDLSGITRLREQFKIPVGSRVYMNVTRMDVQKNLTFAVDVFNEILKKDPSAIFVYGGVMPEIEPIKNQIEEKIDKYGIRESCRFTGPVLNVEQLYHLSDVWIYCSVFEGLPFGPLELQAAGIPVVVSDVITREIDLGLNLVKFLSLEESPAKWAQVSMELEKPHLPKEQVYDAFRNNNFDICQGVNSLETIYKG